MESVRPTGTRSRSDGFLLLVADPDVELAKGLADALAESQVTVMCCADGAEVLLLAGIEQPDAVVAAASLPTLGSAAVTRALRARTSIPVVIGIGASDGLAAAEALAAGASACVARPYRLPELLPLLRAIRPHGVVLATPPIEVGSLRLDLDSLVVQLDGMAVKMPMRELHLLHLLMINADRVVTREQIRDTIWGGEPGSNTITVHVQRLRQKLGDDPDDPRMILTVRGVGYRLVPPASATPAPRAPSPATETATETAAESAAESGAESIAQGPSPGSRLGESTSVRPS